MQAKTVVAFWAAVAAAVFLLGGSVASFVSVVRHASPGAVIVLVVSLVWLAFSLLIAGRIVLALGRLQRRAQEIGTGQE